MKILLCIVVVFVSEVYSYERQDSLDYLEEDFFPGHNGERFDQFDWSLCNEINKRTTGNDVFSPVSVKLVLAILYEGAVGATADQLSKALNLPEKRMDTRIKYNKVLKSLKERSEYYDLDVGTRLFMNFSMTPKNWFQRTLSLYYDTYIDRLHFPHASPSADYINKWVSQSTRGHLKDLVKPDAKLMRTALLMINTIYFKGLWKNPFAPESTYLGRFKSLTQQVDVHYMTNAGYYFFIDSKDLNARMIRLPYKGGKIAMYILLPNEPNGLTKITSYITPTTLRRHIWLMEEVKVDVTIPKFKFEFTAELKNILQALGITEIFDENADLRGISNKNSPLVVSDVIQKSGIEVNEYGTEAYSATEVQLINRIAEDEYVFNASHPFLFFIEDESTGTILFVGKVVDPSPDGVKVEPVPMGPSTSGAKVDPVLASGAKVDPILANGAKVDPVLASGAKVEATTKRAWRDWRKETTTREYRNYQQKYNFSRN